jgi:hypothetical protein
MQTFRPVADEAAAANPVPEHPAPPSFDRGAVDPTIAAEGAAFIWTCRRSRSASAGQTARARGREAAIHGGRARETTHSVLPMLTSIHGPPLPRFFRHGDSVRALTPDRPRRSLPAGHLQVSDCSAFSRSRFDQRIN